MDDSRFELITPANRTDYEQLVYPLADACWPEFMLHDPITELYWDDLFERFADYQFGLLHAETGKAVAMGNSLPLHWDADLAALVNLIAACVNLGLIVAILAQALQVIQVLYRMLIKDRQTILPMPE